MLDPHYISDTKSTNQTLVNLVTFEKFEICEQWISMCSWANT